MCKSKLGLILHVRTCRVTVPDLKNGWTDCAQIWYTDRDQLPGCRESQLEASHAVPHVQGLTSRSCVALKRRLTGMVTWALDTYMKRLRKCKQNMIWQHELCQIWRWALLTGGAYVSHRFHGGAMRPLGVGPVPLRWAAAGAGGGTGLGAGAVGPADRSMLSTMATRWPSDGGNGSPGAVLGTFLIWLLTHDVPRPDLGCRSQLALSAQSIPP